MLVLQKIMKNAETTVFHCGNPGIEEQIKGLYFASLLREGYAYEIISEQEIKHRNCWDTV